MKSIAILSASLVALSGTAGLGLSALHEFNMNVQTAALSTPDNIPADSGFVIPDYVPEAAEFTALAPALEAPVVREAPALAPVEVAALGDFEVTPEVIAPEVAAPVQLAPAVREAIRAPARALGQTRAFKTAPVIVDQALIHTPDAATRIDYVIGVYR